MRIAIIGASGQVGRGLVEAWSSTPGIEPIAIVRNTVGATPLRMSGGFEVRIGDAAKDGRRLLADCDAVVNAALASGLPHAARRANDAIAESIVDAAAHGSVRRCAMLSSVAVYGSCIHPSTGSTFERPRPTDSYGRDKLAAEEHARRVFSGSAVRLTVVRLGHVIGAHQVNSRAFVELAGNPLFAVPFEGRKPSNTIHVARLARLLAALFERDDVLATYDGVDAPNATWGSVFAYHTESAGAPPARLLGDAESSVLRDRALELEHASRLPRALRTIASSALRAGIATLAMDRDVRDLGHHVLVAMPASFEAQVKRAYLRWSVRKHVGGLGSPAAERPIGPQMLSEGAPGPALGSLVPGRFDDDRARASMARWTGTFRPPAWAG